jgi:hypothetical protein
MRRRQTVLLLGMLPFLAGGVAMASPPATSPISGVVSHLKSPISGALVVFYNLADTSLARSRTAGDGTFVLASAPVGVYDLIAYKKGFRPALLRLWHEARPESVSAVHIELSARAEKPADPAAPVTIWDLRDRVPSDVLREVALEEFADGETTPLDRVRLDRLIAGEVRTIADVADGGPATLSRTAVGVRGGLPNGWKYDLRGDYSSLGASEDSAEETTSGSAAGFALDVLPSSLETLRLATRRHTISFGEDRPASLQTHTVAWSRGEQKGQAQSVAARYVEEVNLYRETAPGSLLFPLASRTWELQGRYSRPAADTPGFAVAMTYRHREGAVGPSGIGWDGAFLPAGPDADLAASTSVRLSSKMEVEGGIIGRYTAGGYGLAPKAVVRYDLGNGTTLFVSGLQRVAGHGMGSGTVLPRVSSIEDNGEPAARRAVSIALERGTEAGSGVRLEVSEQRMDELVRAFFEGDFLTDFDSVYLLDGNRVRQYRASARHKLSNAVSGAVSVRYGDIGGGVEPETTSSYGIVSSRGHFWAARASVEVLPTRTGVAILVRGVRQSLETNPSSSSNDSNKVALSIAQDLSVLGLTPLGSEWKLILAAESARSAAGSEREDPPQTSRLMGGVALAF